LVLEAWIFLDFLGLPTTLIQRPYGRQRRASCHHHPSPTDTRILGQRCHPSVYRCLQASLEWEQCFSPCFRTCESSLACIARFPTDSVRMAYKQINAIAGSSRHHASFLLVCDCSSNIHGKLSSLECVPFKLSG